MKSTATPAKLTVDGKVPEAFVRTKFFMQQHVFNSMYSENEMMRYMTMFITIFVTLNILLKNDMKIK